MHLSDDVKYMHKQKQQAVCHFCPTLRGVCAAADSLSRRNELGCVPGRGEVRFPPDVGLFTVTALRTMDCVMLGSRFVVIEDVAAAVAIATWRSTEMDTGLLPATWSVRATVDFWWCGVVSGRRTSSLAAKI